MITVVGNILHPNQLPDIKAHNIEEARQRVNDCKLEFNAKRERLNRKMSDRKAQGSPGGKTRATAQVTVLPRVLGWPPRLAPECAGLRSRLPVGPLPGPWQLVFHHVLPAEQTLRL